MKKVLFTLVVLFVAAISSIVTAASPKDVKKVIEAMGSPDGSECIYQVNNKRYQVLYTSKDGSSSNPIMRNGMLRFLVFNQNFDFLYWIEDYGLDGAVEWAEGRNHEKHLDVIYAKKGREHQEYWQKRYDEAIANALKHFRK